MKLKNSGLRISGIIFGFVALLHILRLVTGAPVLIGDWVMPLWINQLGALGACCLCIWLWWLSFRGRD